MLHLHRLLHVVLNLKRQKIKIVLKGLVIKKDTIDVSCYFNLEEWVRVTDVLVSAGGWRSAPAPPSQLR